ncbi:hypothetical protein D6_00313 [Faustovirus]|nr:hypothetical protein D6_00313 [Faustovirus]AMP44152.1 hypothetical protein PRJ_Dakar_00196 [Faustovirus]
MATFENYMTSYIFNKRIDPIKDAIAGQGIAAKYYHRGIIKVKSSQCRVQRDSTGKITNRAHLVKLLLLKCRQFRLYALQLYIAGNLRISDANKINFAVIAKLPVLMVQVEKSTHEEAAAAIQGYDLLASQDTNWCYKALMNGQFKLNELNAVRWKVLEHLIDMLDVLRLSFRFLHERREYYFGVAQAA